MLISRLSGVSHINVLQPSFIKNVSFVSFNTKGKVRLVTFLSRRGFPCLDDSWLLCWDDGALVFLHFCDLILILQVECVGSVDSGLSTMSWSPDQELVLLATGINNSL